MAVSKQEVIVEFNAETGNIDKAVSSLEKDMQGVAEAATDAAEATEDIGESAKKSGGLLKKAGQMGADGFKLVGAAITATGLLGLLSKVLEPIIAAFLENKTVADALKVVMAALGVVINGIVKVGEKLVTVLVDAFNNPQEALAAITEKVNELKDRFFDAFSSPGEMLDTLKEKVVGFADTIKSYVTDKITALIEGFGLLGKAIGAVFSGDFEEAASLAADGLTKIYIEANPAADAAKAVAGAMGEAAEAVGNAAKAVGEFVTEAVSAVVAGTNLEQSLQSLADRERDLSVVTAQSAAEVEELKRQRDDERLSIDERIKAAEAAAAIDQRIANENVRIQEEKARLLAEEIELQGETEERLQALADAQIAAADARAASAGVQTELMTSLYALNQELIEQGREQLELLQETAEALEENKAKAEEIEVDTGERQLMQSQQRQTEIYETESQKRRRIRQEEFDVFKEFVLKDQETMLNASKSTLDTLTQLNEAFTGESEEQQKKGFERAKKIQAAQALISTFEATIATYKSVVGTPFVGPVLAPIAAAATAAVGLKNVQKIKQQQFQGGGGEPDTGTPDTAVTQALGGGGSNAPSLDLSFLGQGAGQAEPIQAYVLAENVSNAQQANQKIQDQATL